MKYILILLLLVSCQNKSEDFYQNTGYKENDYIFWYDRFVFEASRRGIDVSNISVEIMTNNTIQYPARCVGNKARVEVNKNMVLDYIEKYGDWYLDFLMNHELGHCVLKLNHTETGMMRADFPTDFIDTYYLQRENLLDEMFKSKIINDRF